MEGSEGGEGNDGRRKEVMKELKRERGPKKWSDEKSGRGKGDDGRK